LICNPTDVLLLLCFIFVKNLLHKYRLSIMLHLSDIMSKFFNCCYICNCLLPNSISDMKCEVVQVLNIKAVVFWDVLLCSLIDGY
jgi:hypothetical protein